MEIETIWVLMKICLVIALITGAFYWFIAPKKWIVWSEKIAEILPQETPAPWASLNKYGKALFVIFTGSLLLMLALMLIGFLAERSYL